MLGGCRGVAVLCQCQKKACAPRAGGAAAGAGQQARGGGRGRVRALHGRHLEQQGHAGGHPAQDVRRGCCVTARPPLHLRVVAPGSAMTTLQT